MSLLKVMHVECGEPAYLCNDKEYISNSPICASDFFDLDGNQCQPSEEIRCKSCGKNVRLQVKESGRLEAVTVKDWEMY